MREVIELLRLNYDHVIARRLARSEAAARRAAAEQRAPGRTEAIEYEDETGKWHSEVAPGNDRPETDVEDSA